MNQSGPLFYIFFTVYIYFYVAEVTSFSLHMTQLFVWRVFFFFPVGDVEVADVVHFPMFHILNQAIARWLSI